MTETYTSSEEAQEPAVYEIRLEGQLADHWVTWFEGLTITREDGGGTVLSGTVVDQAALYGLLRKVRDLGVTLVSVTRLPALTTGAGEDQKGDWP